MAQDKKRNATVDNADKKKITRNSLRMAWKIFAFLRPYRTRFISGLIFLLFSSMVSMAVPYMMGRLIDSAKGNNAIAWMNNTNLMGALLLGALFIQSVLSFFRVYLFATVSEKAMADVRIALFDRIVSLSVPFFESRRVGELTSRSTNDVDQLQDMLSATLPEFIRQVITIFFGVLFIFFISPKLTLMMISTFPLLVLMAVFYGRFIRKLSKDRQDALADSNIVVEETLQNIHTVKAFTNENYEAKRYRGFMHKVVQTGIRGAINRGGFATFLILGLFGGFTIVIWYGTSLLHSGQIYEGDLFSFVLYTGFIGGSVGGLGDMYGRLQKTVGASERVFEILHEPVEFSLEQVPQRNTRLQGKLEFRNVDFSYPARKDMRVLNAISFTVHAGEKIALAGHSGVGKSTIAQLILRFYDPLHGSILFDDTDASAYEVRQLRGNMAIVPQEVLLFGGTIRENIAYGNPGAGEEALISAAKKANAWQFIAKFPEQLDTLVGERGVKLSGGQRQRIAIARAILKDPSILILDEATSSLDAQSEKLVQDALEELMKNRTTIIIAHRLSTIRNVDAIYVLDKGKIVETGTFDQLARVRDGVFSKLLQLQIHRQEEGLPAENGNSSVL